MEDKKKKERQLDLELSYTRFEIIYKILRFGRYIEKMFTVLPFWRNGFIWLAITSSLGISIISTLLISKYFSDLPEEVPLLYNTTEETWKRFPKIYLYGIPLVFLFFGIISIQLLQRVYYMNKKMTLMICSLIPITYFLGLIALNEILTISLR